MLINLPDLFWAAKRRSACHGWRAQQGQSVGAVFVLLKRGAPIGRHVAGGGSGQRGPCPCRLQPPERLRACERCVPPPEPNRPPPLPFRYGDITPVTVAEQMVATLFMIVAVFYFG